MKMSHRARLRFNLVLVVLIIFSLNPFMPFGSSANAANPSQSFIKRSGSNLTLNGSTFRFAGANVYWLGLNENPVRYPTKFEIDDALATAQEMGATVVRATTLGTSVGCSLCLEPSLNVFNNQAFDTIDYAIKSASAHGLRLIIPLTDNWHYYHGGKHTFTEWRGLTNEDAFFTNATVIADFKKYISTLLNHTNAYTGVALKSDPTILAWETGNEMGVSSGTWSDNWTSTIATYIKSIAKNHLVADGHSATAAVHLQSSQMRLSSVDIYSTHFYPTTISSAQYDSGLAKQNNKVYFTSEYDWTGQSGQLAQGTITPDTTDVVDGLVSARIAVNQSGTYWYVQLTQGGIPLTANQTYHITFWAKAGAARPLHVNLNQDVSPYNELLHNQLALGTTWAAYDVAYTPTVDQPKVLLSLNFADATGTVWLDKVSLKGPAGVELLGNGSFEAAGPSWLSPWTFTVKQGGDTLPGFLAAVEDPTNNVSGDMYWSLFGHADTNGYLQHSDGQFNYTLHYPGDTQDMADRAQLLRTHAYKMSGKSVPASMVPPAPLLRTVSKTSGGNVINWQGAVAAKYYSLERSTDKATWSVVTSTVTDNNTPWTDSTAVAGVNYFYRVRAINLDGVFGPYSNTAS